jgi:FAD/FMN-containing dehydrogenase/Fe-S oxidoreductase
MHDLALLLRKNTQGEVLFSEADRARYATDASIYQQMPVGVFVPKSEEDVALAIDIARDLNVPILARGGGTSQCGQTTGVALVMDCSKYLRRSFDFNAEKSTISVQPGMVLDHLNAELKKHGLWFPVDVSTSAQATLGGMAGNNSCGSRSIAYGNMVHNVIGAQAWFGDGTVGEFGRYEHATGRVKEIGDAVAALALKHHSEIEEKWPKVMRRVAGYNLDIFCNQSERPYNADGSVNLAHLLVGSEGTLAFTKSLTLQLSPLPRTKTLGIVNFPTFRQAMSAAQHIVKLRPTAVELVDRTMVGLALKNPAFAPTMRTALIGEPEAILLVEFSGDDKAALTKKLDDLAALMGDLGLPQSVVKMSEDAPQKNLWEVRKAGLNIMMSLKGDGKPVSFIEDCAVPLEHLADYTDALTEVFAKHGSRGTWYAHASVGTLHVRPILDMRREGGAKMRAIGDEAAVLVRKYKGAFSGEHGDGLCRGEWIAWQFGPKITEALREIKTLFDPTNVMNPGKIIDPPKMDDASLFRLKPGYKTIPIKTALDWRAWDVQNDPVTEETTAPGSGGDGAQGFGKAVEMCNNNGHCRKFDAGTMCPSYRVTRDEAASTRGRANTLRMAVSGQLGSAGIASEEVHDALALCVSCKGCKRDCPTGVDMAKMKIEHLSHYNAKHGVSIKDKLIAYLPNYARTAAAFAPVMNVRNRVPFIASLMESALGFSAKRSLPAWRSDHFFKRFASKNDQTAPQVLGLQPLAAGAGVVPSPPNLPTALSRGERGSTIANDRAENSALSPLPSGEGRGEGRSAAKADTLAKEVILFVDTFNAYFNPEIAFDAITVLERAGYTPIVIQKAKSHLCCGRTFLAAGMVEQAKEKLSELIAALVPYAKRGVPIVGLEPSCLFTLRDEALAMHLGEDAELVAKHALLIDTFLANEHKAGKLDAFAKLLKPAAQNVLVHGHCHQKAFAEITPTLALLNLIPNANPTLIESSCCGMAGAFGYEAKHYEVSMQMAELSMLPAIRNAKDSILVADGTSCRHQIQDGAQREAQHVVSVLARYL